MGCCLTFAATRDRVPCRCGMASAATPSQGRARARWRRCAQRLLLSAQRALVLALTGVGELADPHGRRSSIACSIVTAITDHDFVHFALLT
jgi:hypothetical protein